MIRRSFVYAAAAAILVALAIPAASALGGDRSSNAPDAPVFAATALGTGFTYQGRLTDAGEPANGTYDLRFFLYDAAAGGAQVGPEVLKEDVVVTDGVFTAQLDFGAGIFKGDALWLEVAVKPGTGGAFTVLNPRQALTPVPYALHATTAAALVLPYTGTGTTTGLNGLFQLTQLGDGRGIAVAAASGTAIYAESSTGLAASFVGPVRVAGELEKAYTPTAFNRALPIAYGVVKPDGTLEASSSSGNVSTSWNAGLSRYEITIAGENVQYQTHVAMVTVVDGTGGIGSPPELFPLTASSGNFLVVKLIATPGTSTQNYFQFVVFGP